MIIVILYFKKEISAYHSTFHNRRRILILLPANINFSVCSMKQTINCRSWTPTAQLAALSRLQLTELHSIHPVTAEDRADACYISARLCRPSHRHLHARHTHSLASQSNASKITIWQKNTVKLEKAGLNIARHSPSLPIFNTNGLTYGGDRKKRRTKDTFDELTEGKLLPDFARSLLDHFSESFVRKTIGAKHA